MSHWLLYCDDDVLGSMEEVCIHVGLGLSSFDVMTVLDERFVVNTGRGKGAPALKLDLSFDLTMMDVNQATGVTFQCILDGEGDTTTIKACMEIDGVSGITEGKGISELLNQQECPNEMSCKDGEPAAYFYSTLDHPPFKLTAAAQDHVAAPFYSCLLLGCGHNIYVLIIKYD